MEQSVKKKKKPHWVDEHLVPLDTPKRIIAKARTYATPQEAWDDWDTGIDMLWMLSQTKADRTKTIHCLCDIAERVLPIFEKTYPEDKRPREAIEAARQYADSKHIDPFGSYFAAHNAAHSAYNSGHTVAAYAALAATHTAAYIVGGATHNDLAVANLAISTFEYTARNAEDQAHAEIIRRYFPEAPKKPTIRKTNE